MFLIPQFECWLMVDCQLVAKQYGKSFDFPKQHGITHVVDDIQTKGSTGNQSTRPGEGSIQEVKQQYQRTNCRAVEKQVRCITPGWKTALLMEGNR